MPWLNFDRNSNALISNHLNWYHINPYDHISYCFALYLNGTVLCQQSGAVCRIGPRPEACFCRRRDPRASLKRVHSVVDIQNCGGVRKDRAHMRPTCRPSPPTPPRQINKPRSSRSNSSRPIASLFFPRDMIGVEFRLRWIYIGALIVDG